ncbi:MAG TPA: hypothetical protein VN750_00945 [Steroidobacteraceae bacterium]|nr:hypothetical protein [Steroidobacteraceae bacterium]
MTAELVERQARLIVSTPYNPSWAEWCRDNGGVWDPGSKAWTFKAERREEVEAALERLFEEES